MSPRPSVEAQRREGVLVATCAVISEVGFRHVRIADVAEHIGTSTGIIHYYFRTKGELLEAAFRFVIESARARSTNRQALAATMARLPDPAVNLAAFGGIVFPLALLVEAPIIMLLAASTIR